MTIYLIIGFSVLLLIAYVFDLTSEKTKIPSVILLMLLGWFVKFFIEKAGISLPDFSKYLPILGTLGLILIVLEGSLELNLDKSKLILIKKSFYGALFPMLVFSIILAIAFNFTGNYSFKTSLLNAMPFAVISSAIAIPSVINLSPKNREFVIYESSFSDILGVIIFNFLLYNEVINFTSFLHFSIQLVIIIIVSLLSTFGLSFLLNRIDHHIKYVPIILLIILIYGLSKIFHLPALIFILLFGLSLNNLDVFKKLKWFKNFENEELKKEVVKFRDLVIEGTFLVRASFFILFGYLIETKEVVNTETLPWAAAIVAVILIFRFIQLKISKMSVSPLVFVAPRGLITILLFLTIKPAQNIPIVNKSLLIQVILLTALIMMGGLMFSKKDKL